MHDIEKMQLITACIDTAALSRNLARVRALTPAARVLAVIKADAYGHGSVRAAKALETADAFGVARLAEAAELREHGIESPILLLEGVLSKEEMECAAHWRLAIVVHSETQLSLLEHWRGAPFSVWLKIDTGMNRLGFDAEYAQSAYRRLMNCKSVAKPICAMSHLSSSDLPHLPDTHKQLERFRSIVGGWETQRSVANSAHILTAAAECMEWVRPGIMLYGCSPLASASALYCGLTPAMTLETMVIAVRRVRAGERVGYASTWTAARDSVVAIAAGGYGDGYPRNVAPETAVLVNGERAPLAGRVSMDMLAIDISNISPVKIGDPVVLWGCGLPVEEIAAAADTISYDLLCRVSKRVHRSYR